MESLRLWLARTGSGVVGRSMAQILFARSMLSDADTTSDPATAETIAHLNTLFTALDVDGSGTITAEEFHQALKPYMDESSFSKCVLVAHSEAFPSNTNTPLQPTPHATPRSVPSLAPSTVARQPPQP